MTMELLRTMVAVAIGLQVVLLLLSAISKASRPIHRSHALFIIILMVCLLVVVSIYFGSVQDLITHGFVGNLTLAVRSSLFSLLYLWACATFLPDLSWRPFYLRHIAYFVLLTGSLCMLTLVSSDTYPGRNMLILVLLTIYRCFYFLALYRLMHDHTRAIRGVSSASPLHIKWVRFANVMQLIAILLLIPCFFMPAPYLEILTTVITSVFLSGTTFLIQRDSNFYRVELEICGYQTSKKYKSSALTAEHMTKIAEALNKVMNEDKVYTRPNLCLSELARAAGTKPHYASQVLSEIFQQNFYDYANSFRIEAAKKQFDSNPQAKILDICFEVGFNSKSSFNSAFKRLTHKTPSEYKKNVALH